MLLVGLALVLAGELRASDPALARHAVVRLDSHGASATVISTTQGRTVLLTCAHAFRGPFRSMPITLDAPWPQPGPARRVGPRLVAIDERMDLALVELPAGPFPYCAPVAPADQLISRVCLSVGYDEMKLPPRCEYATIVAHEGAITLTREMPWHGRSGGGLIDPRSGCLVGVVMGYEVHGQRRGLYVSHQAVIAFLRRSQSPGGAVLPGGV